MLSAARQKVCSLSSALLLREQAAMLSGSGVLHRDEGLLDMGGLVSQPMSLGRCFSDCCPRDVFRASL